MGPELTVEQKVLVRATELIGIKDNWIKRSSYRSRGEDRTAKYCAIGAIHKAACEHFGVNPFAQEARKATSTYTKVVAMIRPYIPVPAALHVYNDNPDTTHEDIKAVFCAALKEEVKDEQ